MEVWNWLIFFLCIRFGQSQIFNSWFAIMKENCEKSELPRRRAVMAARAIIRIWWSFVMGMAWICSTAVWWCFLDWVPPISPTQNSVSKKFNGLFLLILMLSCPLFLFHSTAIWIWCSFHAHHQIIWGTRVAKSTRNSSMKLKWKSWTKWKFDNDKLDTAFVFDDYTAALLFCNFIFLRIYQL